MNERHMSLEEVQSRTQTFQDDRLIEALVMAKGMLITNPSEEVVLELWNILRPVLERFIPKGTLLHHYLSTPEGSSSFVSKALEYRVTLGAFDKVYCVDKFVLPQDCPPQVRTQSGVVGKCTIKLHSGTTLYDLGTMGPKECRAAQQRLAKTQWEMDPFLSKNVNFRVLAHFCLEYAASLRFVLQVTKGVLNMDLLSQVSRFLKSVEASQSMSHVIKQVFTFTNEVVEFLTFYHDILEGFAYRGEDVEVNMEVVGVLVRIVCYVIEGGLRVFEGTSDNVNVNIDTIQVIRLLVLTVIPQSLAFVHQESLFDSFLQMLNTNVKDLEVGFDRVATFRHDFFAYVLTLEKWLQTKGFTLKETFLMSSRFPLLSAVTIRKLLDYLGVGDAFTKLSVVTAQHVTPTHLQSAITEEVVPQSASVLLRMIDFVTDNRDLLKHNSSSILALMFQKAPARTLLNIGLRSFEQRERYATCGDGVLRLYRECLKQKVPPKIDRGGMTLYFLLEHWVFVLQHLAHRYPQETTLCDASIDFPAEVRFVEGLLAKGSLTFQELDHVCASVMGILYCDALDRDDVTDDFRVRLSGELDVVRDNVVNMLGVVVEWGKSTTAQALVTSRDLLMTLFGLRTGAVYGQEGVFEGPRVEGFI